MLSRFSTVGAVVVLFVALGPALADEPLLLVGDGSPDGLVVVAVDLTGAARWCGIESVDPRAIRAVDAESGQPIAFQFIPGADDDARARLAGTAVLQFPAERAGPVRLRFGAAVEEEEAPWDGTVSTPAISVVHDGAKAGGFPSRITFAKTGKVFENFRWNDRVYDRDQGWFGLANDPEPKVERIAAGPLCTVVRVRARYLGPEAKPPESQPEAVYDWHYFHDRPLVFVRASMAQKQSFAWPEHHFLELNYPQEAFPKWAGGQPAKQGEFTGSKESLRFADWGAVVDGPNAVGMFACGQALLYDGGGGTYLHAHGSAGWNGWRVERPEYSAWLWIGSGDDPAASIAAAADRVPRAQRVTVTVDSVHAKVAEARAKSKGPGAAFPWWAGCGAAILEAQGRLEEAARAAEGAMPPSWDAFHDDDLGVILERLEQGIRMVNLFDRADGKQLLVSDPMPLFHLTLRHADSKEEVRLAADSGWSRVACERLDSDGRLLRWEAPVDRRLGALRVEVRAKPLDEVGAIGWTLAIDNPSDRWSLWRVVFPQVAVADLGADGCVLYPQAAGVVRRNPWQGNFRYSGTYPSGWTSLQFLAAYQPEGPAGLYLGMHDPWGSTKDIVAQSRPSTGGVVLAFDHPAPDMGVAGNDFEVAGQGVVGLLRGDWYDAAVTYRNWVRKEAKWFPKLTAEGREDTPSWMRELACWALSGGAPKECVEPVKEFARALGVPVGFHWYNWHQIPFDNDYPHYFPTKEGFAEAVAELREAGVHVMPYINGRLWDTRDKGVDDFEFTALARPAATKDEQGEPYVEMYRSKETDGSRVALAVMCPATELWQNKVGEIVLRLFDECGVSGVYIDQVAAARPRLCFDRSHGHPLGGGPWWTQAYWTLMDRIREAMPEDRMLTTECNAEPYTHVFDGYLTWHWQYDGQVAAFPAVYGGAIQMFGRAYRGGPTKDLALRMKAGQQLVFGEQIGWISPGVVKEEENAEFFRQVVRLRHRFRRYFHAGEMARPPKLIGSIPRVTADWQWSGEWPVTTDALMAGAWVVPGAGAAGPAPEKPRLLLLFANVGDEPISARLDLDAPDQQQLLGQLSHVDQITADGSVESHDSLAPLDDEITFPPRSVRAWELSGK